MYSNSRGSSRAQESSVPWRDLTRTEMIFYLNCGGIVGVWLDDLRRQGLIQTRQKPRTRVATLSSPEKKNSFNFERRCQTYPRSITIVVAIGQ